MSSPAKKGSPKKTTPSKATKPKASPKASPKVEKKKPAASPKKPATKRQGTMEATSKEGAKFLARSEPSNRINGHFLIS